MNDQPSFHVTHMRASHSRLTWGFVYLACIASIGAVLAVTPLAVRAQDARVVRLAQVNGDVQVQHLGSPGFEVALANMPLQQGDTLATGNGFAEIEFENGATGYIGDNSALQFTELGIANASPNGGPTGANGPGGPTGLITRLSLTQGTARFIVHVADADVFEVSSEGALVSPRERADFRVDAYSDGLSVSVFRGAASVLTPQAPAGSPPTAVEQGHMLSFHSDNPQAAEITDLPNTDALDAWAAYSNAMIIEGVNNALQYMPQGAPYAYGYGMSELSDYGSWYNFPGYGWGWQPFGVNSTWIPFSNGTWRFAPHFGYCWISFERWGWLPYHFGNWVHAPQGWAWIPGKSPGKSPGESSGALSVKSPHLSPGISERWQPAVVNWVRVGNQVGWVPRAPGDEPNKLPANVKYGVVTSPLESTTTVLRGPNNVLRSEEVKNARVLNEPPNKILAATAGKSMPPFAVQTPMNRVPPFGVAAPARPPASTGSGAIVYDRSTHAYVNGNPGNVPANGLVNRSTGVLPPGVSPPGGPAMNRMPPSGRPAPMYRPMPPVSPARSVSSGARFPIAVPRIMPRPMPAPMHPQSMPGAPHPAANPAGRPAAGHPAAAPATPSSAHH